MIQKKLFKYFIVSSIAFLPFGGYSNLPILVSEQQIPTKTYDIRWVQSYNSSEKLGIEKKFVRKLHDFFFGPDNNKLVQPVSVVTNSESKLFILDAARQSLNQWDLESGKTQIYDGFPSPVSLCLFGKDKVLFTDAALNEVFVHSHVRNITKLFADTTTFDRPVGIGYLPSKKQIWITESGLHQILVLSADGEVLKRIGRRGNEQGEFNFPTYIWVDKNEQIYVVDAMNFRVQIFNSSGKLVNVFGKPGDSSGYFSSPKGIATDSFGNIYIADALFHAVQIFDQTGYFLYSFGSQGSGNGEFWMPAGIFIDKEDHIFVADKFNARIQEFELIQRI